MNVILIGLMGAGKSSVGRKLAALLGRPFLDVDTLVELKAGKLIRQIFESEGEDGFRRREAEAIAEVTAGDGQVIATGGGAVLRFANRAALRQAGLVVWLDAPPAELYERAKRQGVAARPLLAGADPLGTLTRFAAERAEHYEKTAHYRIDVSGRPPEAIAAEIERLVVANERDHDTCRKSE